MTSDGTRDDCSQIVDLLVHYLEDNLASGTCQDLERRLTRQLCPATPHLSRHGLATELRKPASAFLDGQTVH